MVAENPADTDEQVIDLTELIEKGNVPADDASAQPSRNAEADGIQEQLNALNDSKAEIEGDIDDLLAQMDMMEEAVPGGAGQTPPAAGDATASADAAPASAAAVAASADHPVDPNEELFMPGMGDVDNLLNSLDIPPQPSADVHPAAGTADQAVDAMLNELAPDQPAATPQTATPDATISEDGLASLLAAIDGQQEAPQAAPAAAQPAADPLADDLDAILAAAAHETPAAPQPEAAPAAATAAPADDLEALLAAAAPEAPAAPQP
ncbi:MAG: hypothetical protein J6N67_03245, partial [Desulfovibrio sp.]|nr:hypothetical protein [Desulfovibrio sp.]